MRKRRAAVFLRVARWSSTFEDALVPYPLSILPSRAATGSLPLLTIERDKACMQLANGLLTAVHDVWLAECCTHQCRSGGPLPPLVTGKDR